MHTHMSSSQLTVGLDLGLLFIYFCHFVLVLFAFVVLGLVSSILREEIARKNVSKMTYFMLSATYNLNAITVTHIQYLQNVQLSCLIIDTVLLPRSIKP